MSRSSWASREKKKNIRKKKYLVSPRGSDITRLSPPSAHFYQSAIAFAASQEKRHATSTVMRNIFDHWLSSLSAYRSILGNKTCQPRMIHENVPDARTTSLATHGPLSLTCNIYYMLYMTYVGEERSYSESFVFPQAHRKFSYPGPPIARTTAR